MVLDLTAATENEEPQKSRAEDQGADVIVNLEGGRSHG